MAPAVRQDTKNRLWRPKEREKAIDVEAELRETPVVRRREKERKEKKRKEKEEEQEKRKNRQ